MEHAVFITSVAPWPVSSGVQTKLNPILNHAPVDITVIGPECVDKKIVPSDISYIWVPRRRRSSCSAIMDIGSERLLPSQGSLDSPRILSKVSKIFDSLSSACHVHLDTIATAHLARPIRQLAARSGIGVTIVSSINDSYSFLRSEAGSLKRYERAYIERNERKFLPAADLVDVVSPADIGWLARVVPEARTRVVPLAVQPEWSGLEKGGTHERDVLLFSGGPGVEAFLRVGMPRLRKRHPNVRVSMVGPSPGPSLLREAELRGIEFLGFVPDIAAVTGHSRVILAPSQQRCGISNRAMMGFVNATCVVGGDCLTNFVGALPGREYLHGGTSQLLADRVAEALESEALREGISSRGYLYSKLLPTAQEVGEQYWDIPKRILTGVNNG